MLIRYENEKEARYKALEDRRAQRQREEQEKLRNFLAQQVAEKKAREANDKENINQQAKMWNLDKANWEVEEKRLKEKIDKINSDNQQFLLQQMALKNKDKTKMNKAEFAINKPLLREANQKLKGMSQADAASRRSELQE